MISDVWSDVPAARPCTRNRSPTTARMTTPPKGPIQQPAPSRASAEEGGGTAGGSRTGRAPRAPPTSLGVAANRWLPHPTTRTGRGCSTLPALPRGSWPEQLRLCLRSIARLWTRWAPVVIAGGPRVARCLHRPGFLTRSLTETWQDRTGRLGARESSRPDCWDRPRTDGTHRDPLDVALCAHNPEVVGSNPPLPTCQRYYRRSTARKLSLRAVFGSGGGVRSDQIPGQGRLGCPAASQVG